MASTLVAAAPVVAVADGPLPAGGAVAVAMVTTAAVITVTEHFATKKYDDKGYPGQGKGKGQEDLNKSIPNRHKDTPPPKYDPQPEPWWVLGLRLFSEYVDDL